MANTNRKKSSLLINPKFQWTLIAYTAIMTAVILITVYCLVSFAFHEFSRLGTQAGLPPDHVYYKFIQMQVSAFIRVILALAILIGIFLIVGGLYLSHRIAGPIYRMQKELRAMAEKSPVELKTIQFRKGDFFPELADTFNELVEAWKKKQ